MKKSVPRTTKAQWQAIYDALFSRYGMISCPLKHATPFQLLAAVMLSAQCTDKRVNVVTGELFRIAPTPEKMAALPVEKIEALIASCGLFHSKAKNLSAAAKQICETFHGEVPQTMEALTSLAGIGRKSANVVLGNCFGIPGFPVDTHVKRLLNLIGVVRSDSPEEIERIACRHVAPEYWTNFSHLLIFHGREVCKANRPDCKNCVISKFCRSSKNGKA